MSGRAGVPFISKGRQHLTRVVSRHKVRVSPEVRQPFVHPRNRFPRWNIVPGDKVRIINGSPGDKFVDERSRSASGWKIYTVKNVDQERNHLYLDGLVVVVPKRPPNFDQWDAERQREWRNQWDKRPHLRPISYSNVQLCVEENGSDSVFAVRIATSAPSFNENAGRFVWNRYAAKLSGPTSADPDPDRDQVRIPWPFTPIKIPNSGPVDTSAHDSSQTTLALAEMDSIASTAAADLVPSTMRSPPPSETAYSDEYIDYPPRRSVPLLDSVMPLYLSEELSPRFSRAKQTKGWNDRRETLEVERTEAARRALREWEEGGRDGGLVEMFAGTSLDGVKMRPRTRKEVREAALLEFDLASDGVKQEVQRARALGQVWRTDTQSWVEGPKGIRLARKQRRKAQREINVERKLENLKLVQGKNMVVPEALRAERSPEVDA